MNESEIIPIMFIHCGNNDYLEFILNKSRKNNPNTQIILIGNRNDFKKNITNCDINLINNKYISKFINIYQHMNVTNYRYDFFNWARWFYIFEYMKQEKLQGIFHFDSDVMLFSSIDEIINNYSNLFSRYAICIPNQKHETYFWAASGHCAYFSFEYLEKFCEFIIDSFSYRTILEQYKKKWKWHKLNNIPGGICDMTGLYFFSQKEKDFINLLIKKNNSIFDNNINNSDNYNNNEYEINGNYKKIIYNEGHPYFIEKETKKMVKVNALHFQGEAKKIIGTICNDPDNFYSLR